MTTHNRAAISPAARAWVTAWACIDPTPFTWAELMTWTRHYPADTVDGILTELVHNGTAQVLPGGHHYTARWKEG